MVTKEQMKPSDLVLRCYVEREQDGSWFAICLDLNLATQADTARQAKQKLHTQIEQYVREAMTVDLPYLEQLIPRKAPLGFFVKYYLIKAVCAIRGMNRHSPSAKRIFKEHLPVVPA